MTCDTRQHALDNRKCIYFGQSGLRVFLPALYIKLDDSDAMLEVAYFVSHSTSMPSPLSAANQFVYRLVQARELEESERRNRNILQRKERMKMRQNLYQRARFNRAAGKRLRVALQQAQL